MGPRQFFFDLWSRFYDLPWVQRLIYRPVHDAVLAAAPRHDRRPVLDVGCGTGLFTTRLRRELQRPVVGCDFSAGMLEQAAARSRRVGWVQANALTLPFRDQTFGAVVSTESFHWFPDQQSALIELFRVTAPKGKLLVALINPPLESVSEATHVGSRLVGEPLYWPTPERMREQVEAAGFLVQRQQPIYRLPATPLLSPVLTVAIRPA